MEGNRFSRVGRAGEIQAPAGAVRVDLTGKTVMPAIVDLHSHIGFENATTATEKKENYTRENLIDHLERFAYTGHAATHSLGSDLPDDLCGRCGISRETILSLALDSSRLAEGWLGLELVRAHGLGTTRRIQS